MPTYYVSHLGSNTSPYDTWAKAANTMGTITAIDAAGDTIYVADTHVETAGATVTMSFSGTLAAPTKVICATTAAEPPTVTATSAVFTTSSTFSFVGAGAGYFYGLNVSTVSGGTNATISINAYNTIAGVKSVFENCNFTSGGTGGTAFFNIGGNGSANANENETVWYNTNLKTSSTTTASAVCIFGTFKWFGGAILTGTTKSTSGYFRAHIAGASSGRSSVMEAFGVDLSNLSSTQTLCFFEGLQFKATFKDCKLPSGWSGAFYAGTMSPHSRMSVYNCDAGATNYKLYIGTSAGTIREETTIVKASGASDGTTPLAWKLTTNATSNNLHELVTDEIVVWNDTVGTSKTVSLDIVHDSQGTGTGSGLTNDECWIEVVSLGSSVAPLGTTTQAKPATPLTAATTYSAGSATWTTTGLTTPVKQTLSVTFTPQMKGFVHLKVHLAKPSATVYVDPLLTIA